MAKWMRVSSVSGTGAASIRFPSFASCISRTLYWSVLKYFVEPVDPKDCLKAFEQFELVVKYEASGHKVLSDQGYTFLQQLAWIVRHKICGH